MLDLCLVFLLGYELGTSLIGLCPSFSRKHTGGGGEAAVPLSWQLQSLLYPALVPGVSVLRLTSANQHQGNELVL